MPLQEKDLILPPDDRASGVFASTLTALYGGSLLTKLDDAIRELTESVGANQAKGELVLKLTIAPAGQGVGDTPLYKVVDEVKVTLPRAKSKGQTFFADEHGNLSRRSPNQAELGFRANPTLRSGGVGLEEARPVQS